MRNRLYTTAHHSKQLCTGLLASLLQQQQPQRLQVNSFSPADAAAAAVAAAPLPPQTHKSHRRAAVIIICTAVYAGR